MQSIRGLRHSIRNARLARGFTLLELSKIIGYSSAFISQIENGHAIPKKEMLDAIAAATNFPIDFFFRDTDSPYTIDKYSYGSVRDIWESITKVVGLLNCQQCFSKLGSINSEMVYECVSGLAHYVNVQTSLNKGVSFGLFAKRLKDKFGYLPVLDTVRKMGIGVFLSKYDAKLGSMVVERAEDKSFVLIANTEVSEIQRNYETAVAIGKLLISLVIRPEFGLKVATVTASDFNINAFAIVFLTNTAEHFNKYIEINSDTIRFISNDYKVPPAAIVKFWTDQRKLTLAKGRRLLHGVLDTDRHNAI